MELSKKEKSVLTDSGTGDGKQAKKDERHKKAQAGGGQKGGGGRGARESGTKKTKNKYRDHAKGGEEDEVAGNERNVNRKHQDIPFLSAEEVSAELLPGTTNINSGFVNLNIFTLESQFI